MDLLNWAVEHPFLFICILLTLVGIARGLGGVN
jgi:hypothetical protein